MSEFVCVRRDLCDQIIRGKSTSDLRQYLLNNFQLSETDIITVIESIQKNLTSSCNQKWTKAQRKPDRFESLYSNWLNGEFKVPLNSCSTSTSEISGLNTSGDRGRPTKPYDECSENTKKRKNMELLQEYGMGHVRNAYVQGLRSMGENDEASIVSIIRNKEKDEKKAILQTIISPDSALSFTKEEALSMCIETDLTKAQYGYLRKRLVDKNLSSVLPSYQILSEAKKACYPPASSITVTNISAKINLQDLLDHTVCRIIKIKSGSTNYNRLKLFTKWGCDGSSGQSEYKQILPEENEQISDANLFIVSLVPLRLVDEETSTVIWQNPTCSSVRYCRPISLEFAKETPEKTTAVVSEIEAKINQLISTLVSIDDKVIEVKHELFMTMIDGKVAQVLTNTSSSATCTVCGATPRQMNDLLKVTSRVENEDAFKYGLSTLHAWIRFMETILHISYNLGFEKWSATTPENKQLKEDKKKYVQKRFREVLGLHIDKPRQGSDNSNDGNTARRFFQNYECSAGITGIDGELIKRFYVILQTMSSGFPINAEKFGQYTLITAQLYVSKYNWYYMPSSVHKVLIHGAKIIEHYAVLPIGQLSEDAQEARNKDYKKYRLHHARKCSRSATNEDVLHILLYTSDPYISSLNKPSFVISKELFDEAKELLEIEGYE